ncbi:MAG: response regulator [SAR202 cluster bacterium]|nr:response regulator [SAR202 cluster bacterium]
MEHPRPQVLIVDDQYSIRRTMTGIIEDLGCQVEDVEDGYQAIERVRNSIFDLVFLDIKMPGINGIQTYREIKKMRPDSLVVMMTGFEVQELIDSAVDEGAMCVVYKPFEPEQIVQVLRSANTPCPEKLPTNIGSLVAAIQRKIGRVIEGAPIARVAVRVPDGELRALRLVTAISPASLYTQTLGSSASLGGVTFYDNESRIVNDYVSHPLSCESDIALGVKSALAVPIRSNNDRVLGSVVIGCYEADYFSPEVVEGFHALAGEIGNMMEAASPMEAELLDELRRVGMPTGPVLVDANR